ncbi:SMP-30/gluconolactonase/LRE family protein [Rhizorhapis suberifaciens]|uniref:Lactonase n=1 Tax=Rhizorhapis suberifaciens TaxID=13656 RepID=A0A840HRR7_9SPHN|nr:SMP-30/gluconolactonase/LRE family protein [Rhizorhapis suberifaciens]MBB4640832.1 lactonase [Rhizorhapis suberifaciens]
MVNAAKLLMISACAICAGEAAAQAPSKAGPTSYPTLTYSTASRAPAIPPAEAGLQTIVAQPWFAMTTSMPAFGGMDQDLFIEGPLFDAQGNLLFVEVQGGRIMRLSPKQELTMILPKNEGHSSGLAVLKNGRILVAGGGGNIVSIRQDGSDRQVIVDARAGYKPNDLAMDKEGGFYFTDFKGNNTDRTGGVYHVAADMKTITPIMTRMSEPNGIAISPDGKTLWVGEVGTGILHRINLVTPTQIAPVVATTMRYHFTGATVDSLRTDSDGNVYAALAGEGRVMVFNPKGVPIGQILIPDRERGELLFTTSMAIKPGTRELYILSSDYPGRAAKIHRAGAFAKAAAPTGP